jgi:hypothetical protein
MRRVLGLLLAMVVALGAVAILGALSIEVGWFAAHTGDEEVRWEVAALAFTGIATLFLALATFSLARQTQQDVDASTRSAIAAQLSAEVAADALSASIRPILGASPGDRPGLTTHGEDGKSVVSFTANLRNVGEGLALVEGSELLLWAPPESTVRTTTSGFAVPRDQPVTIEIDVVFSDTAVAQKFEKTQTSEGFQLEVRYRDINGEQLTLTRASAAYDPSAGWEYTQLALYRDDETEPYTTLSRTQTVHAKQN